MSQQNLSEGKVLTIKRTFNVPVKLVWEAWSNPEYIAQWWGPKGLEVKIVEHNFTVGGKWKYTMDMPQRGTFISEGIYSIIREPEEIMTSANFKPMTEGVDMQMLFEDAGEQTKFTFNVYHATEEYRKQQEDMGFFNGWGSVFEGLERYLEEIK